MTGREKQAIRFTIIPTIEIIDEEPLSFSSRSPSPVEQPIITQAKNSIPSPRVPRSLSYTPPDVLMFPLFSAIQRKSWGRAKKLCHEVILCDPERKIYHELYIRLEQLTNFTQRRLHSRSTISQTTAAAASADEEQLSRQQSQ